LGVKSNSLRGLVPGVIENANALNPATIVNSLSGGLTPECIEINMETIDKNNKTASEKRFVSVNDIENMDPCDFGKNGRNPMTRKKCGEGFTVIEEVTVSKKNNKTESTNAFPETFENSAPFYEYNRVVTKTKKKAVSNLPEDDVVSKLFYLSVSGVGVYILYRFYKRIIK